MKITRYFLLLAFVLSACTTTTYTPQDQWPAEMPPRSYFIDYYQLDPGHQEVASQDQYLLWIKRFYLGWQLYQRGWLQATDELVATLDDFNDKQKARAKSLEIGQLISAEWAKDSRFRVINTRHLYIWGNTITRSIVEQEQLQMLERIKADAKGLLAKDLVPKDIKSDRYYATEEFGVDISGDF